MKKPTILKTERVDDIPLLLALKLANIDLSGTHPLGIDDARNISKLLPYILGQQTI
jgi:inhibitor of KinA sporulation pathway (predicted exonuclease)